MYKVKSIAEVVGGGVLASKAAGAAVAVVARKATEMADASAVKRTILRDLIFWGISIEVAKIQC